MRKFLTPLATVVILMIVQAGASVVTSVPGGTLIPMPAVDYFGPGPQTFGVVGYAVTWTSTNAFNNGGATFGYDGAFGPYSFTPPTPPGLTNNGQWTGARGPMAGLNDSTAIDGSTDTMTFAFSKPVSAVGGFLNYLPFSGNSTTIAVYDSKGNLIEAPFNLSFLTGGNDNGFFYGFKESSANISYFTLTDNYVGITNLTVAAVPEPTSLFLIGSGLLGAIGFSRRRLGL